MNLITFFETRNTIQMAKQLYIIIGLLVFISQQGTAQNGKFDLHFLLNQIDCNSMEAKVDITLKAANANSTFNIAEQNYRMSFQREAINNPVILEELDVSGPIELPDGNYALYSSHSLVGSIDTVISYNVELQSDHGYEITETQWTNVGRLGFDIIDPTQCLNLMWHKHDADFFPNTIITEKYDGGLHTVNEVNEARTFNLLQNDMDLNGNLDMGSFTLINTSLPPASQMTVTTTTNPGEIVCTPASGFMGVVNTFEYSICDTENQCVTARVYASVEEDIETSIDTPTDEYDIRLSPTAANDYVSVEYLNITTQSEAKIAITDVNGRMVQIHDKLIAGNPIHRFDVSNLSQGVYFLSTMIEGTWISRKFIKI